VKGEAYKVSGKEYSAIVHFTFYVLPFTIPVRSGARLVALLAIQALSQMLFAPFFRQNPGPIGHRWLMTDMLTMAAFQISHPIAKLIHMIADNRLLHAQASLTPSLSIS
jgi:hypothetical protein